MPTVGAKRPRATAAQEESSGSAFPLVYFVGQLPFTATPQSLTEFFQSSGSGKVTFRLLTDRATGKSRGMGFLELVGAASSERHEAIMACHRQAYQGRRMNVEPSMKGSTKSQQAKQKLQRMKSSRDASNAAHVQRLVEQAVADSQGMLKTEDVDSRAQNFLRMFEPKVAKQALLELNQALADRSTLRVDAPPEVESAPAYLMGIIKRMRRENFQH